MSIRILATSPLVGPHLKDPGLRFPQLGKAPYRPTARTAGLAHAEALGTPSR